MQPLLARAQGPDCIAALASHTLGALVQLAPIREALLKGQGLRPLVVSLRDADTVLPGMHVHTTAIPILLYHVWTIGTLSSGGQTRLLKTLRVRV